MHACMLTCAKGPVIGAPVNSREFSREATRDEGLRLGTPRVRPMECSRSITFASPAAWGPGAAWFLSSSPADHKAFTAVPRALEALSVLDKLACFCKSEGAAPDSAAAAPDAPCGGGGAAVGAVRGIARLKGADKPWDSPDACCSRAASDRLFMLASGIAKPPPPPTPRLAMGMPSLRTVVLNCFFQTIIFLYLMDNDTSWMVLMSNGIGLVIEYWKVTKALNISFTGGRIKANPATNEISKKTKEYDEVRCHANS